MIRRFALVLTVLTGFSGLVYEVAWQKYLATLLGAHSEATAAVLGIFLGGLAVGYSLFGRLTRGRVERAAGGTARLLRFYGGVEAGIGLYALLFPTLFTLAQRVSLWVPGGHEGLAFGFDLVLTAALLLPPTVLMGGTIPVLTQALAGSLEEATRVHAWVYGFNTAGAFVGALAGGFVLVPWLGLDGVLYAMGAVNLTAGLLFVGLDAAGGGLAVPAAAVSAAPAAPAARSVAGYAAVAFLAGYAMMCVQTVLNRVGALSFGASHFTFAMVVAVFVLSIALGSLVVSALPRVSPAWVAGSQWALVGLLAGLYFVLPDAPYWAHVLRSLFRDLPENFYPYHGAAFLAMLALLALPIGLSGALLPLLFHHLRREVGDLGGVAGRLYSWNTLGSLLGAVLGGYALLFWLDLHQVYRLALGALALGATLLTVQVLPVPRPAAAGAFLACVLGLTLLHPWSPDHLSAGLFRDRQPLPYTFAGPSEFIRRRHVRMIFHRDDPTTTVVVEEGRRKSGAVTRAILTNGKPDGELISDYPTMALAALLPALLAEKHERCFVIGYGTGITVGQLAALEGSREVTVAEISSGVLQAAPLFDHANHGASTNPKVRLVRSDAYRALLRSSGRYDVIASEPSNPWVSGVEMLFSQEFLRAARDRLEPGGVYAQWFHGYETDERTIELVLRTYRSVFDHIAVWYTVGPDVLLLGFRSPEQALDVQRLARRFAQPDFQEGFERAGIRSLEALLAHEVLPLGVLNAAVLEGPVHTLRHPILSDWAARAFFVGRTAELPRFAGAATAAVGARNSLVRRYAALDGEAAPEPLLHTLAEESCGRMRPIECAATLGRGLAAEPGSSALHAVLDRAREEGLGGFVSRQDLQRVEKLYDGAGEGRVSPAEATRLTDTYERFFLHALPFDGDALERAWDRCSSPQQADACRSGRRRVRALLQGNRG